MPLVQRVIAEGLGTFGLVLGGVGVRSWSQRSFLQ